jgi:hypothetical protein
VAAFFDEQEIAAVASLASFLLSRLISMEIVFAVSPAAKVSVLVLAM